MRSFGRIPAAVAALFLAGAFARASSNSIEPPAMQAGVVLNLNLIEALVAIKSERLGMIFSFVPEDRSALAFANFLMADHKALKMFLGVKERQWKKFKGIARWDKQVFLLLVGMNSQTELPPGIERLPEKLSSRVNELALAQGYELEEMRLQQAGGGAK